MSPSTVTREAGTSPSPRRRPWRRPSISHLLIALVVAAAFVLNLLALQDRDDTVMVAVAGEDLPAGSALDPAALRFIPVGADFEGLASLFEEGAVADQEGWVLRRPLADGELIERAALAEPGAPSGLRSMSIPVPIEHAAGGTLGPGDRIDVISVRDGVAAYVASDIEVLQVAATDSGAFASARAYHVVVALGPDQALAISTALDSGSIELIRSTGAKPLRGGQVGDDS